MIIYIDIDDTICTLSGDMKYDTAKPIQSAIDKVNKLYESGHTIVFWTARGTGSGIDWRDLTEFQLNMWGVKYHQLKFGKPIYDLFIDDKPMNSLYSLNEKS